MDRLLCQEDKARITQYEEYLAEWEEKLAAAKENKAAFEQIRDRIVAELNGTATPDMIVTQLDSLAVAAADSTKVEKAEK